MKKTKNYLRYEKLYQEYKDVISLNNLSSSDKAQLQLDIDRLSELDDNAFLIKIFSLFFTIYKNNSQIDLFENLIYKFIPILKDNNDINRLGVCYKNLSYFKRLNGEYELAYNYINEAIVNFKKYGEPIRLAIAYNTLGNLCIDTGELNHALENYYKAFEFIKSFVEHDTYFVIKANLANIYLTLNYFSKAKSIYLEDLDYLKLNKLYSRLGTSLLGIADIYIEEKRLKLAYKYVKRAIENHELSNDVIGYGSSVSKLGKIYSLLEKYPEALANYEKAKKILDKVNYKLELLKLHNMMGETYLGMGHTLLSLEHLELAKTMAVEINQNYELRKIYRNLSDAYAAQGDNAKAYEALKIYTDLNEKMFSMSIQARLSEVQTSYEIDKKEMELKKDLEISNHKLRSLQHQMNPHFIFNSMSTIQNLVLHGDNETTLNFISDFSQLMRTMLQHSRYDTISFEDELNFLKHYTELELIRYQHEFDIIFQIDIPTEEWGDIQLPTMMIQPLIENAIKHGVSNLRGKRGQIIIQVESPEPHHFLVVSVLDNGLGLQTQSSRVSHTSTALHVIEERLKLYTVNYHYGDYSIDFTHQGTKATIKIPI